MTNRNRKEPLSSLQQAAILLRSLGETQAAGVMRHLGPREVQLVSQAMASIEDVSRDQVKSVVADFVERVSEETGLGVGSDEYVRNTLTQALGRDKAEGMIDRIMHGGSSEGLNKLKWMDSKAVADTIRHEHPQIQAIVLSYLEPQAAAKVISILPEHLHMDLVLRIARLESVQSEALEELNAILERQFQNKGGTKSSSVGGVKIAAEIMNCVDLATETQVMDQIKEIDEELGNQIEDHMFIFDNLVDCDNRGIQSLLREISSDTLVLALRGASDEVQEKIFSNMSRRATELLKDDLDSLGPVRISEVEQAQKEILIIARRMAEAGEIGLRGRGAEEMI